MKRRLVITLFILSQIVLICAYIHKESQRINAQYIYQKGVKDINKLNKKEDELSEKLLKIQHLDNINDYARNKLHLKPLALEQVKKYKEQDQDATF